MSSRCKRCWAPKLQNWSAYSSSYICDSCSSNPKYSDHFVSHPITCKFNYKNCINDPGYIYATDFEYYKELYGDMNYIEAAKSEGGCSHCTKEHCYYDDEDK